LGGWQLWYTLDNDTSRFAWADAENGKGVIYRLVDEWSNDCPYDFKNIQMRNPLDDADENYYYTFDNNGIDHSLNGSLCFNNVISKYITTSQEINKIIFKNISNCEVSSNHFDVQCYNNVFAKAQRNNRFGRECYENSFLGYNYVNTFDTKFRKNVVGAESQSMQFGQGATSNVIGGNTYYCRFGNYFRYNTTCRYMYYSEFGHYVQYCTLGESAEAPGQYMRFLTFENNVQYVNLYKTDKATKTYMENVKICSGTVGKSASRIMIEVSELAQKYAITYAHNSDGELVKYCDADGGAGGGSVEGLGALAYKNKVGYGDLDDALADAFGDYVPWDEWSASMTDMDSCKVDAVWEQNFTEEQKARARKNIGAISASDVDWNTMLNKPFGDMPTGGDTLTWDGNTEGLLAVTAANRFGEVRTFYKVSDAFPTWGDILQGDFTEVVCRVKKGSETLAEFQSEEEMTAMVDDCLRELGVADDYTVDERGKIAVIINEIVCVMEDNYTHGNFVFPEKGTYFSTNVDYLWFRGCTSFPSAKLMDEKYLPMDDITAAVIAALPIYNGEVEEV
jgi:hypothetical protein